MLSNSYREGAMSERTYGESFERFKGGDFEESFKDGDFASHCDWRRKGGFFMISASAKSRGSEYPQYIF